MAKAARGEGKRWDGHRPIPLSKYDFVADDGYTTICWLCSRRGEARPELVAKEREITIGLCPACTAKKSETRKTGNLTPLSRYPRALREHTRIFRKKSN